MCGSPVGCCGDCAPKRYNIVRFYASRRRRIIRRNVSRADAQAHCSREDTHKKNAHGQVVWLDGFTEA